MNVNWELKPFGEVCEIIGGSQPPKSTFIYESKEGYIRLIQVRDYRTDKFKTYIPLEKARKFCTKDDIMIGRYGPPIFGIFKGLEGAYNVALMKAVPNENILNKEFLYWFLKTDKLIRFVEKSSKRAAGQDGVRKDLLYKYPTPVPPIKEQKQIVEILDKAFESIAQAKANIEKNIQNSQELFQSRLNEIFSQKGEGWEEKELIEINKFIDYRGKTHKKTESGIRLITAKNVKMGVLNREPEEYIDTNDYESWMTRGIPQKGDVLFTTEAPLAMVALLDTDEKIAFAQRIITLCPNREILSGEYLSYCMQSDIVQNRVLEKGTGATVTGIKSKLLKEILIPIPKNKNIQKKIVDEIDILKEQTKQLEKHYNQKLKNLEELKKSILQKAFSGELLK